MVLIFLLLITVSMQLFFFYFRGIWQPEKLRILQ